jgi:hydroxymethylpyrimidine/phosphomethylpyrimidine kinase
MSEGRIPAVLTIAGSDSGGGAGIQADLKAFAAAGVHGMSAITALTAQNTVGVDAITQVPGEMIVAQVRAVAADIGVDAVKVGMLGTAEAARAVKEALSLVGDVPVVVDPVMVSESGASLLDPDARTALIELILPLATVLTPNLPEARALAGTGDDASPAALAATIRELGPGAVIVTGGHAAGSDVLVDGSGEPLEIAGEMHPDGAAHGSGCTHSSTLAALLASGWSLRDAATEARAVAGRAIGQGLRAIGSGPGPVDVLGTGARTRLA